MKKRHLDQAIQAVYHNYFYSLLPRMLFPGDITEAYRLFLLLLYLLGLFVGILQWILNMLILNLVSNLQILREIEEKASSAGKPGRKNGCCGLSNNRRAWRLASVFLS